MKVGVKGLGEYVRNLGETNEFTRVLDGFNDGEFLGGDIREKGAREFFERLGGLSEFKVVGGRVSVMRKKM